LIALSAESDFLLTVIWPKSRWRSGAVIYSGTAIVFHWY